MRKDPFKQDYKRQAKQSTLDYNPSLQHHFVINFANIALNP